MKKNGFFIFWYNTIAFSIFHFMAVRKIVTTKNPKLRQKSKPVEKMDKKIQDLVKDLGDTLKDQKDPEGVGLAAPQIGVNLRVFVMLDQGEIVPVINPEIISISEESNDPKNKEEDYVMEGCLSLPHYYGPVERSWEVTMKYQKPVQKDSTLELENTQKTFKGFSAQIIQHEVDHLDGKIFVDRLLEQERQLYELKGKKWQEVELP